MRERDVRDIIAGLVLITTGILAGIYVISTLNMGTTARMGPGMFPVALSIVIAGFGVAVLVPALFRPGEVPSVNLVPLVAILAGILVFGLMIRPFGVVPSVMALTLVASRADPASLSWRGATVLAVILAAVATLLFPIGLGLLIPIVAWPW
ncbi:MAG: tripartite tricarboxylate transporter TctB family protein [Acetobacterales bacterium]